MQFEALKLHELFLPRIIIFTHCIIRIFCYFVRVSHFRISPILFIRFHAHHTFMSHALLLEYIPYLKFQPYLFTRTFFSTVFLLTHSVPSPSLHCFLSHISLPLFTLPQISAPAATAHCLGNLHLPARAGGALDSLLSGQHPSRAGSQDNYLTRISPAHAISSEGRTQTSTGPTCVLDKACT